MSELKCIRRSVGLRIEVPPNGGPPAGGDPGFGADNYFVAFLGAPSATAPWMLQFGGHHLAINATVVGPNLTLSPSLTGGQPTRYMKDGKPIYIVETEVKQANAVLASLTPDQRKRAVVSPQRIDLVLGPGHDGQALQPEGVPVSSMTEAQKAQLLKLVEARLGILNARTAQSRPHLVRLVRPDRRRGLGLFPGLGPHLDDGVLASGPRRRPRQPPAQHVPRPDQRIWRGLDGVEMRPDQSAAIAALAAATMAAAIALTPPAARAHPLDEVIQAAYVTLAPGEVQLDLEIEPGTLVGGAIARAVDANGDGRISEAEARAYAERVLKASVLTVNGAPARLQLTAIDTPIFANLAAGAVLHIRAAAPLRMGAGAASLTYLNNYSPLKSQCQANVFLSAGGGWTFRVDAQGHSPDGRRLDVAFRASREG